MRTVFCLLTFQLFCLQGFAQEASPTPGTRYGYLEVIGHTGVFWSRTQYLSEQFEDGYKALEARLGFQSTGKQVWQQFTNYPSYGFGIHYADLVADREDTIVGNPFSAFLFYSAPRFRFARFSLNTDLSLGISYTSVIHDPVKNYLNDVIASHVNLYFDFNVNLNFRLSERIDLKGGYGVTHYSNGRIHMPQKGINNWGWDVGLKYHFVSPKRLHAADYPEGASSVRPAFIQTDPPPFNSIESIEIMYAAGVVDQHRLRDLEGNHYYTSSFTVDYALTYHPRMAISFGLDVLYDGSLVEDIKGIPRDEITTLQKMYFGSHLGYHFLIDRVTILCNVGTYFLQQSEVRGYWFIRAGGRIRLTDQLYAQICIKSKNGVRSDWIEWGFATSFKIR